MPKALVSISIRVVASVDTLCFGSSWSQEQQHCHHGTRGPAALCACAVRFAMDRAGMVGADGATHCGFADITYMGCLPNMVLMAPSNEGMHHAKAMHLSVSRGR